MHSHLELQGGPRHRRLARHRPRHRRALVAEGATVAITGRSEAHLDSARADARKAADRLETLRPTCGSCRRGAAIGAARAVRRPRHPGQQRRRRRLRERRRHDDDDWHRVIDTNLTGVFNCCHAAIPHMRARGGGWIINISSLAGKNAFVGGAAYCASKAGLNAFSEALMQEVRHDDIRVSYVMPGSVATGFSRGGSASGADWKLAAGRRGAGGDRPAGPPGAQPAEPRRDAAVAAAEEVTDSSQTRPAGRARWGAGETRCSPRSGALPCAGLLCRRARRPRQSRQRRRPRPPGGPRKGGCERPSAPRLRARPRGDRQDHG